MHFSSRYIRIHVANLRIVPKIQTRIRSDTANLLTENCSLTHLVQFAHTFTDRTHGPAPKRGLIGTFPRITAIIKIIIYLFISTSKSITGYMPTMILKLIRCHIQTGINRCLNKCFLQVFFIHNCIHHGFAIVGSSVVHVSKRLVMRQSGIGVDRLVRHEFNLLGGHDTVIPLRCIHIMVPAFYSVFELLLFHEFFQIIYTNRLIAMGVLPTHIVNKIIFFKLIFQLS